MTDQPRSRPDDPHDTAIPGPTDDTAAGAARTETARQAEQHRQGVTGEATGEGEEGGEVELGHS